jgi:hypothetical protein
MEPVIVPVRFRYPRLALRESRRRFRHGDPGVKTEDIVFRSGTRQRQIDGAEKGSLEVASWQARSVSLVSNFEQIRSVGLRKKTRVWASARAGYLMDPSGWRW